MTKTYEFLVTENDAGKRLDLYLTSKLVSKTRSSIQNILLDPNSLTINEKYNSNKHYCVLVGDVVKIVIPDPPPCEPIPQDIPIDICYEDDDLLVVNKSKGMVVHPAAGHDDGTLVNALLFYLKNSSISTGTNPARPGIVHRIDKDTSGLLMIAKNDKARASLSEQIKAHSFKREYEAIVYGNLTSDFGRIEAPIGRDYKDRKRMCVTQKNSKIAITEYTLIKNYQDFAHVRLKLFTGRTHQIRVHMSYIGHPLAGDIIYGPKRRFKGTKGQCLHAKLIGFNHPNTGEYIQIESHLPVYFKKIIKRLSCEDICKVSETQIQDSGC